jgi:hypothetical protein
MIWAILAAVGVPLWLCAAAILVLVFRNRQLRKRPGNIAVRIRRSQKKRWLPGHCVWVHDVLAFRGSPAAWKEELVQVTEATPRQTNTAERKKLHRIGDEPIVVTITTATGETLELAGRPEHKDTLLGPFTTANPGREAIPV